MTAIGERFRVSAGGMAANNDKNPRVHALDFLG